MTEMLTAKDVQAKLQVDRSTVYRMAEAGKLPAVKVGKQWRFPAGQMDDWLKQQTSAVTPTPVSVSPDPISDLATLLPTDCVQLLQDSYAELLGVMLIVTDLDGNPVTQASHPCGLFECVSERPLAVQKCIQSWHDLGSILSLSPQFHRTHLGLECARAMIRVGSELKGMVVAGCIAPAVWPPSEAELSAISAELEMPLDDLAPHVESVYRLSAEERARVLSFLPQIANIVSHIIDERKQLVERLAQIARLTSL